MNLREDIRTAQPEIVAGGGQLTMKFMTLDDIVFQGLTQPSGFPAVDHLHWAREQVEGALRERKYSDGISLYKFIAQFDRENKNSRIGTISISEWYDFLRAYDRISGLINQSVRSLTEQGIMNIADFISFYIGFFRYHRFLTQRASMNIVARKGVFVHVASTYVSRLNDELEKLNSTGMILRMANWGRYSRSMDLRDQFGYEQLQTKYSRTASG